MPIKIGTNVATPVDDTPQETGVRISTMEPGTGFSFTSTKNERNTTNFIKMKSRYKNIAVNLSTWKEVEFNDTETGIPVRLAVNPA